MTKSNDWVTLRVNLTTLQARKFADFAYAQQRFIEDGNEHYNKVAEDLKPYIDKNWDLYQAWKSNYK